MLKIVIKLTFTIFMSREMTFGTSFPERDPEKGKIPTNGESGAARARARRAPTNAEKLDLMRDDLKESRLAQDAIKFELLRAQEAVR